MFKKLFGGSKSSSEKKEVKKNVIDWIPLMSIEEVKAIKESSKEGYVGVFKHSTRCSISSTVLQRFERSFPKDLPITMYYLDLIRLRDVSASVGEVFNVIHQSPQFLIIKDGKAVAHDSHQGILDMDFNDIIK